MPKRKRKEVKVEENKVNNFEEEEEKKLQKPKKRKRKNNNNREKEKELSFELKKEETTKINRAEKRKQRKDSKNSEENRERKNNIKKKRMNPETAMSYLIQGLGGRGMGRGGIDAEKEKEYETKLRGDIMMQLQACQELCTYYSMCQNPTIGNGKMEKFGPMIIEIIQTSQFGDLLLIAVRTLTNMIDAVPEVGELLIQRGLLEAINAKLVNVEFIDVVEQCVSCISMLAEHYQKAILKSGTVESMLQFLDFHALQVQRKILSIVANVFRRANENDQTILIKTKDNMINALKNGDEKIVNYAATALNSIVYITSKTVPENLDSILNENVINTMLSKLENGEADTTGKLIESLATACKYSATIVNLMYSMDIEKKIKELLGTKTAHTLQLLKLSLKLLPPVKDSNLIMMQNKMKRKKRLTHVVRKKQKTLLKKFRAMRKSKHVELYTKSPGLFIKFGETLIPEFMAIFEISADMNERNRIVCIIASVIFSSKSETLKVLLKNIPISTFLKNLLSTNHLGHMSAAMDMSRSLMTKLPSIFVTYFMREGVIKEVQNIRGLTLKELPTEPLFEKLKKNDAATIEKAKVKHKEYLSKRKQEQKQLKKDIANLKKELKKKEEPSKVRQLEKLTFKNKLLSKKPEYEVPLVKVKKTKKSRLSNATPQTYQDFELLDYVFVQSDELMREHFEESESESDMLKELSEYASLLSTSEEPFELLISIRDHFNSQDITCHEVMESGIFEALALFLASKKNVSLFYAVFHNPFQSTKLTSSPYKQLATTEQFTHLREFIRKTHQCISMLESFAIARATTSGISRFSGISNIFRSIRQPVQISFLPLEKGYPEIKNVQISPMLNISRLATLFENQLKLIQNDETTSISSLEDDDYIVKSPESDESIEEMDAIILNQQNEMKGRDYIANHLDKMNDVEKQEYSFLINNQVVDIQDSIVKALFKYSPLYQSIKDPHLCRFSKHNHDIYYTLKPVESSSSSKKDHSFIDALSPIMSKQLTSMLSVLKHLLSNNQDTSLFPTFLSTDNLVPETDFVNVKLDAKLEKQLHDPFIASSACIPRWWDTLLTFTPFLFSYKTRMFYFSALSQGSGRALETILANASKNRHISNLMHMLSQRTRVVVEHQKIVVDRNNVFSNAYDYFKMKASQASQKKLEVSFYDEVGTGLGPTLEFYTIVSKEFQSPDLGIWMDELDPKDSSKRRLLATHGLIPLPKNPNQNISVELELFHFLGRFMARALIDKRLIDIPLSPIVLMFLSGSPIESHHLSLINPDVHRLLKKFKKALREQDRTNILIDNAPIEDFDLTFNLPGYSIDLVEDGSNLVVTSENLEEYVSLVYDFFLNRCLSRQLEALKAGFSTLVDPSHLKLFSISELNGLFLGEDAAWTVDMLSRSTHCDHGYTPSSLVVQQLFEILSSYSPSERRSFLKFVTGSPRLPIGGLSALEPPLTIVRKTTPENPDFYLPSVMTCTNYLKLPHYTSKDILAQQLSQAIANGQNAFHLS